MELNDPVIKLGLVTWIPKLTTVMTYNWKPCRNCDHKFENYLYLHNPLTTSKACFLQYYRNKNPKSIELVKSYYQYFWRNWIRQEVKLNQYARLSIVVTTQTVLNTPTLHANKMDRARMRGNSIIYHIICISIN